jgi:hypothetical protein
MKSKWEPKLVERVPCEVKNENPLAEIAEIIYDFYHQLRNEEKKASTESTKTKDEKRTA